jgi:hypothetical protein
MMGLPVVQHDQKPVPVPALALSAVSLGLSALARRVHQGSYKSDRS